LLKATQGEITSRKAAPPVLDGGFDQGVSCALSPENERPTKVAPTCSAMATGRWRRH
jgi:hypothetical protein